MERLGHIRLARKRSAPWNPAIANDQAGVRMLHRINAILQRTQRPGIFPLGSEEGGAAARGRAELVAGIHKASGATSKVPKTSLEPLSVAMLMRICVNRALSSLGNKSELMQRIQQGKHAKEHAKVAVSSASQGREKGGEAGEGVMDGALASEAQSATA